MKFQDYKQYLSPALAKTTDLVIRSGKGCYVTDVNGDSYLDFVQGIAVNALGHSHPAIVKAICEQAGNIIHASFNLVNYESTLELAERLAKITPGDLNQVFFSNGGAEANDGAMKLAKAYTRRSSIIAFKGSFHGRTIGASSVTGSNSKYRKYYEPLMGGVYFTAFPSKDQCPEGYGADQRAEYCLAELQRLFSYIASPDTVAAIIMEVVQGEGGYVVPDKKFVQAIRDICTQHGILLILDEIQTGYGRTGKMFACEHFDVAPDILTLGKAIAGGLPMSAVIASPEIMSEWHPGMHGTTFGGSPVAAAAANAVLDEFEKSDLLNNCRLQGAYLLKRLNELKEKYPFISDVRGLGLMLAAEFSNEDGSPAPEIWAKVKKICFENKLLTLNCGVYGNGMRFATPLNVTREDLNKGLDIFEYALKSV
ncbi:MAG: aspartate aminotransferase family protein [Clostridiales bacterium]|jgi:4-aminobutyrate aminotransferase|nr:aspartate aminotransferase family protein [Clostridiales bacterium]